MWGEFAKILGTVIVALVGGWLALEKVTHETRLASEREARTEVLKRFVTDTDDLNDVFRALTFLVRGGMLPDPQGKLRGEVERYFAQPFDQIELASIVLRPGAGATRAAQAAATGSPPPQEERAPPVATAPRPPTSGGPPLAAVRPPVAAPGEGPQPAVPPAQGAGTNFAAQVDLLNDSTPSVRRATAQSFVDILRNRGGTGGTEAARLVQALVDMLAEPRLRGLSAAGRLNVIYVLGEVPAPFWQGEGEGSAAELRQRLDALEGRRQARTTLVGAETLDRLNVLREKLGMAKLQPLSGA